MSLKLANSASLRQWMIDDDDSGNNSDSNKDNKEGQGQQQQQQPPSSIQVLLLDGGVSTHLEELQKCHHYHSCTTSLPSSTSSSTSSSPSPPPPPPSFQYRSLWSSSLLLSTRGQNDIQTSHETFYNSGCDIISTVTYQLSHYICNGTEAETEIEAATETGGAGAGDNDDNDGNYNNNTSPHPNLTKGDVDALLQLGVQLAHETRIKVIHQRTRQQQHEQQQLPPALPPSSSLSFPQNKSLYVVASIGCYGAALADGSEYNGDYGNGNGNDNDNGISLEELMTFHRRRFNVFMDLNSNSSSSNNDNDNDGNGNVDKKKCNNNNDLKETKMNANSKLDGIAFETVPSLLEVEAIVNVVKERKEMKENKNKMMVSNSSRSSRTRGCSCEDEDDDDDDNNNDEDDNDDVAIWISLACKDDQTLNDGTLLTEVLDTIDRLDCGTSTCNDNDNDNEPLIHGIGVNCFDIQHAKSLTSIIASHQIKSKSKSQWNRAIVFYPNSGEEWDAANETWLEGSGCSDPNEFAEHVVDAIRSVKALFDIDLDHDQNANANANANAGGKGQRQRKCKIIVGGCCRTSPATIQCMRNSVDMYLKDFQ